MTLFCPEKMKKKSNLRTIGFQILSNSWKGENLLGTLIKFMIILVVFFYPFLNGSCYNFIINLFMLYIRLFISMAWSLPKGPVIWNPSFVEINPLCYPNVSCQHLLLWCQIEKFLSSPFFIIIFLLSWMWEWRSA